MQETKKFHLGDILSISTGKLLSSKGMDGIYEILNHMTGEELFTHQLPRASDECRPSILKQLPFLVNITVGSVTPNNFHMWLNDQVKQYGEYFEIKPLSTKNRNKQDPVQELEKMMPYKGEVLCLKADH